MTEFNCAYCHARFDTDDNEFVEVEAPHVSNGYRPSLICGQCHEDEQRGAWEPVGYQHDFGATR